MVNGVTSQESKDEFDATAKSFMERIEWTEEKLARANAKYSVRKDKNLELKTKNSELKDKNLELKTKNAELKAEVARLTAALNGK
ncbi:hypothetical protein [Methanobrevibacter millerae]|uniref:Uncharacterized protein n=1 Tax=Methanobrevibacter millerae TaxID=230361 RepID=A0A1G5W2Q1_9EURY|nr:hypothetical protein [Methanobrevibacter millerae]SDA52358.1 hypothetical protein SAMN02910315_01102 [Methanobrevibacter millerae]